MDSQGIPGALRPPLIEEGGSLSVYDVVCAVEARVLHDYTFTAFGRDCRV